MAVSILLRCLDCFICPANHPVQSSTEILTICAWCREHYFRSITGVNERYAGYNLADHVGGSGVSGIGGGVKLPMAEAHAAGDFESKVPDTRNQPLDERECTDRDLVAALSAGESISAFNSSI